MMKLIISENAINNRKSWIEEIKKLKGNFSDDADKLERKLQLEINKGGFSTLIDHLRLCGNIPESYGHDTSEEKMYSKYTDCLLSLSYSYLGLKSIVLKERADAADVEVFAKSSTTLSYTFVADAKAFRISRTAKNQKDFKVQAMNGWKKGKDYAMVVCPIYQLPASSSQIYHQATSQNVCIFTYSHLALLILYSEIDGKEKAQDLLENVFKTVQALMPSKNATDYWLAINKTFLSFSDKISKLWEDEKGVSTESIKIAKDEALTFLALEREKIMKMGHEEALKELLKLHKIDSKIKTINNVTDNRLFYLNK